jgi:hypothetical protein
MVEGGLDPRPPRDTSAKLDTLFVMKSPPLREILPALEKPSQNQIAEILFKTLGLERTGVGTADSGRAVIERQLTEWGIAPTSFAVRDGSGLSRHDYIAPDAIVRVLDVMRKSPSLPSTAMRFRSRVWTGRSPIVCAGLRRPGMHAKTGFVDKARSLSGYVTTANGRPHLQPAVQQLDNDLTRSGPGSRRHRRAARRSYGSLMLTVPEASARILEHITPLSVERLPLLDALGRVLAESVRAPMTLAAWDNSAMDGYAVQAADIDGATADQPVMLRVLETVAPAASRHSP